MTAEYQQSPYPRTRGVRLSRSEARRWVSCPKRSGSEKGLETQTAYIRLASRTANPRMPSSFPRNHWRKGHSKSHCSARKSTQEAGQISCEPAAERPGVVVMYRSLF